MLLYGCGIVTYLFYYFINDCRIDTTLFGATADIEMRPEVEHVENYIKNISF